MVMVFQHPVNFVRNDILSPHPFPPPPPPPPPPHTHTTHPHTPESFRPSVRSHITVELVHDVRLSLLTMTNPNQLCDVLLFVCSKMADETKLSSKLPVADRTREV